MADDAKTKRDASACIRCGLCGKGGSAFIVTRDERFSPRNAMVSIQANRDSPILYSYMLNDLAEQHCPVGIAMDDAVIAAREQLVEKAIETSANKAMISKLNGKKNPYS
jgi:Fe-S oxidoreductase